MEPLETVEIESTAGSDAQLDRIESKLDELLAVVSQVQSGLATAQKNPMVRQFLKQYGLGE